MASVLKGDMDQVMNTCEAVNKYHNLIVGQPVIEWLFYANPKLRNLSKDLVLLRVHANQWLALWNEIYSTGEDIVDFGSQFSMFYKESSKYASTLTNVSSTAEEKKQAEVSINSCLTNGLLPLLKQKLSSAQSTKNSCQTFHNNFMADFKNLKKTSTEVEKVIGETNSEIDQLKTQIQAVKDQPHTPMPGPVLPGIPPQPDLSGLELMSLNFQLSVKEFEVAQLNIIKAIINKFSEGVTGIFDSSAALYNSWISISQSIDETIEEAVHAKSDAAQALRVLVTSDLKTMNDDWQDTTVYVQNLLPKDGVLPDMAEDGVVKFLSSISGLSESDVLKLIQNFFHKQTNPHS